MLDAQCMTVTSNQMWQDLWLFIVYSHLDYMAIELCPKFNNYCSPHCLLADELHCFFGHQLFLGIPNRAVTAPGGFICIKKKKLTMNFIILEIELQFASGFNWQLNYKNKWKSQLSPADIFWVGNEGLPLLILLLIIFTVQQSLSDVVQSDYSVNLHQRHLQPLILSNVITLLIAYAFLPPDKKK